ncbi:MAG: hypothetical protein ACYTHN_05890 [Planctomycetota bacterium]|jgi:hypothetical protein
MRVAPLDTERSGDVRQFIRFPFDLYRGDPFWVPPILSDMEKVFRRKEHPFYRHADADFFLAERGRGTVGRIAVAENRRFNQTQGRRTAVFDHFEVFEDLEAARGLLEAAGQWARERGLNELIGPRGFLPGEGLGWLVEGFDFAPATGSAYNPPYYDRFAKDSGFEPLDDYLSGHLHGDAVFPERIPEIAEKVKRRRGFRIQAFRNKGEMRRWIPRVTEVYNRAFSGGPGFCPIDEEEAAIIAERILSIANPQLVKLVMKGDEIVGFLFAYPNINAALRKAKGKLWPFGWLSILREAKRTRWVDVNGVGLLPEVQGRGANAVLYDALEKTLRAFGFEHANIVQINEKDQKIAGDMKALGVQWCVRHRVYRRAL